MWLVRAPARLPQVPQPAPPGSMLSSPTVDSLQSFMGAAFGRRKPRSFSEDDVLSPSGRRRARVAGKYEAAPPGVAPPGDASAPPPGGARALSCTWEVYSAVGAELSSDKTSVTCTAAQPEDSYVVAAGSAMPRDGTSEFVLTIVSSEGGQGAGMLLGVAEALPPGARVARGGAAADATAPPLGRVWGLAPWNGRLLGFPHASARDTSRSGELRGESLMRGGDLRGLAAGATVRVRVDMHTRHLSFQVNGGSGWTTARLDRAAPPLELPSNATLRPFVRCARANDRIRLSDATHTRAEAPPPPPVHEPPLPAGVAAAELTRLTLLVESLRTELDGVRAQLARERERRLQAEVILAAARERPPLHRVAYDANSCSGGGVVPAGAAPSAREIEAGLLREVLLSEDKVKAAAPLGGGGGGGAGAGGNGATRRSSLRRGSRDLWDLSASAFVGTNLQER